MRDYFSIHLDEFLDAYEVDQEKYNYELSIGAGVMTFVPWITIGDKEFLIRFANNRDFLAQYGFYIVFLFESNMEKVYLSLNQGWTYYEKRYGKNDNTRNLVSNISREHREKLNYDKNRFPNDHIILNVSKERTPKGYEYGHICGKGYDLNNLPSIDEMKEDLHQLMIVYDELIDIIGDGKIDDFSEMIKSLACKEIIEEETDEQEYQKNLM